MSETTPSDLQPFRRSTYAVWEVTLKCNMACSHCGSRAGERRDSELTTAEALDLVQQLDEVGIREVAMIGGEAYLRPDWPQLAQALSDRGIVCTMVTGGLGISRAMAEKMRASGICAVAVSIDGLEATHDRLRGVPAAWHGASRAMAHLREAGLPIAVNTQVNRETVGELLALYDHLRTTGIYGRQVQLTMPMGNASDRPELLLQPYELLELFPLLAELATRCRSDGIRFRTANNLGYYGPFESRLRGDPGDGLYWPGCQAGLSVLGIQANGQIKGCGSLPSEAYVGGNVRDMRLRDIILGTEQLGFNRVALESPEQARKDLWGYCRDCYYADVCRAGCTWTSHSLFGRRGNNPYCHHRALEMLAQGFHERVTRVETSSGKPFDHALFELSVERVGDA